MDDKKETKVLLSRPFGVSRQNENYDHFCSASKKSFAFLNGGICNLSISFFLCTHGKGTNRKA